LSVVFPQDDPGLPVELEKLGQLLPQNVQVLVGGSASEAYLPALEAMGAKVLKSLDELDLELDSMRRQPRNR
jgi:hypothetical protein